MSLENEPVGDFVSTRIKKMLLRPRMYAASPDEFDAVLWLLDEIYSVYGNAKPPQAKYRRFVDYLRDHGCGSATFCSRQRMNNPEITDDELWEGISTAWKEYLSEFITVG